MSTYYTPRDLARDMGQSDDTARRVMAEQGIEHRKGEWYRLDPTRPKERLSIEQVKDAVIYNPKVGRRYGRRRIRRPSLNPLQPHLC